MSEIQIEVQPRDTRGKNANRKLRSAGQVPAVVYGGGKEPVPIQVNVRTFEELMRKSESDNPIFLLKLGRTGKSRHTMIREMQLDSVTGRLIHLDFQRVNMDQTVRVQVPIELVGEAIGVKNEGGLMDFVTREVEVECLPDKIPAHLTVDVSPLHTGQHFEAGQLELPEGVELHVEPTRVIVSVAGKRGGAEEEGAADQEGLEPIAAEPELIKRGKAEEGEEG